MHKTSRQTSADAAERLTSCLECGSESLEERCDEETFEYGGREKPFTVTARIPSLLCTTCGFRFYNETAEQARHEAACRQLGVMTPAQIRALRKRYGYTQGEFAELTGLGVASLGRWERGEGIQNEAYDALLHLATVPENVERLQSWRQSPLEPTGTRSDAWSEHLPDQVGQANHQLGGQNHYMGERAMPRYWVIAPVESKPPGLFDKVWKFDLANNLISIGWHELGDVSKMSREELSEAISKTYPGKPPATRGLYANMIWAFYHDIRPGDFVVARRGRKMLAAVGKVSRSAFYSPGKNPTHSHPNFLEVSWQEQPRDKVFPTVTFPMYTIAELPEEQFRSLLEGSGIQPVPSTTSESIEDPSAFVLEKYLEDFIVSNFGKIFKGQLKIYEDAEGNEGQQYATDIGPIDILAVESNSKAFVVIELKKGRPSDQVVGQILRYMGWVKQHLCTGSEAVKGLIICRDPDPKLSYALAMTNHIDVRYYSVSFKLGETP